MTRLSALNKDQLDEERLALWDAIAGPRGDSIVNDAGGLHGPFNAWLHAPVIGRAMSRLGAALRFEMSIDRRLIELAIITVGAHHQAEFEWYAHAAMARDSGVSDAVIDSIGNGEAPAFEHDDERVVYDVARQLVEVGRVDDAAYQAAAGLLGEQGMVELVSLCGYYSLISYTLNAFEVPLPEGVEPKWLGT